MPFLDSLRGAVLGFVDWVNIFTDPFDVRPAPAIINSKELELKANMAWAEIKAKWLYGPEKEFYWHMDRNDLGDMCIWQGFYTATCAFMGDVPALDLALSGMEKLLYLGGDTRLCRGADGIDGAHAVDPTRKYYEDGNYVFTDNCSESSLIGFLFGIWAVRQCFPKSSDQVKRANKMAVDIGAQVYNDGMRLLNKDGSEAKFGDLRPGLTSAPIRISAGACALLMGETGIGLDPKNATGYREIANNNMGALTHPETHIMFVHPWYQDVIAYAVLLMQATTVSDDLKPTFSRAMGKMWAKTYKEDSPLYCAMAALASRRPNYEDILRCARTLDECNVTGAMPSPKIPGTVTGSSEGSFSWGVWKWKQTMSRTAIPVWRRPQADFLWQRCPYSLNGGSSEAYNWMDYCLAWSMGRKAKLW